jgi:hypothetical protein
MPKKKTTINTNGIICSRQDSKKPFQPVPIQHGEQQKKWQKEFEIGISFISFTNDHLRL